MNNYSRHPFSNVPSPHGLIKWTIILTVGLSFLSIFSNAFFTKVLNLPGLHILLGLSPWGIKHLLLWQFVTYIFLQPLTPHGIDLSLIIKVFFDCYLLYVIGSSIIESRGIKHFIGLFFGGTVFVGVVAYFCLLGSGSMIPLVGASNSIYILLIGWAFLFPEALIMVFLMFPLRSKWLVSGLIGINLFLDFSNGNFLSFVLTLSSLLYGYGYSVLVWNSLSPFARLHSFEKKIIFLKRKLTSFLLFSKKPFKNKTSIFDFKTGRLLNGDSSFADECLDSISAKGIEKLSYFRRYRLKLISFLYRLKK